MEEILIVEDERTVREQMAKRLEAEGYRVRTAHDGEEGLALFRERRPDLILLDIMMPRLNGYAMCEAVRRDDPLVPIVFNTARRSAEDKFRGFGCGADDYFEKKLPTAEKLLRIRALLRRVTAYRTQQDRSMRTQIGSVTVDFGELKVTGPGVDERLTKTESDLLRLFCASRGRLFSYQEIFTVLRGTGFVGNDRALQTHVYNVKRKLGKAGAYLCNERNAGYMLMAQ